MTNLVQFLLPVVLICLTLFGNFANGERFWRGKLFRSHNQHQNLIGTQEVNTFWFNQTLDHFNAADTREWKQRYFINDTFYKPGGPIFLMIGGEGEDNPLWMSQGAWITYAEKLNAFCFSLEHRYYGQSHPTPDLEVKNLAYLSSEQALADLAWFTDSMKDKYNLTDNKWVAFGGSYPGSLAAWYRMKYPHLIYAAVSTSAPLEAKLNFQEYLGVVRDSINRTNPKCLGQIDSAIQSMEGLLKRRTGWWILKKAFKMCDDFRGDSAKDVANFFESMAGNFEDIVQYNEDNREFEGSKTANISIGTLCDIMTNETDESTPMQKYAKVNDLMISISDTNCTDIKYSKLVKNMQQSNWNSSVSTGERQWTYQTCTEFGFYQSSDLKDQPFGHEFGINFSVRQCRDVYGSTFSQDFIEKAIKWSNANYGAKNIKVTRVIFVNGSIDPWHSLGITSQNQTTSDNVVIFIDGTAHCANMYPDSPKDLPQLTEARAQIIKQLTEWLK